MQVNITTSLPDTLLKEVDAYVIATGQKKNQIIQLSIEHFLVSEKKKRMANSFKKAALDKDILAMSEEGFDDYSEQLKKLKI
jgi:metal-responsive CopG/Arc/MetJ family transcriptional regulator